jgi:excisionase family DNA binding protein
MSQRFLPVAQRGTVSVRTACDYSGLSRSTIYELIASKELDSTLVQGRRLIRVPSLLRLVGAHVESDQQMTVGEHAA